MRVKQTDGTPPARYGFAQRATAAGVSVGPELNLLHVGKDVHQALKQRQI